MPRSLHRAAALLLASLCVAAGWRASPARRAPAVGALRAAPTASLGGTKALSAYEARAAAVTAMEKDLEELSSKDLRAKTQAFRERLAAGESLDDVLEEAFATVREASWRVLGMRHYDVQLIAGMALNDGKLAEMATGEGKTLAATLPAYLNALSGEGALVVTANDYLAKRDAETMGQVHRVLGLSVGLVQAGMSTEDRAEQYAMDITYVSNAEVGFDYLRDNLALDASQVCLLRRLPGFCLVDEADSILIDEARTPLVIAERSKAPGEKYAAAAKLAAALKAGVHYEVDAKGKTASLTDRGFEDAARALGGRDLFDPRDPWAPFVLNAVKAKELFQRDVDYILRDDEVCIVDSFSGRVLEGRRWSDGLHQSVEAKEGIAVDSATKISATVTYQNLFKLFPKLAGMSGTALSSAPEFSDVYGLDVLPIPTALPLARRDYPDVAFKSVDGKFKAVAREVAGAAAEGRPVLVGTISVEASERLVEALRERNVTQVALLNAKADAAAREAAVVAQAGRAGAITVSTNMAGRGTDIILGGNAGQLARLYARDALAAACLSAEERAKLATLDEVKEAAGGAAFASLPCEVPEAAEAQLAEAVAAACGAPDGLLSDADASADDVEDLVALAAEKAPVRNAQVLQLRSAISALKESFGAALAEERKEVLSLGGLYVVGTEKAESPRVDQQLRGRSGRQGDPGASRFFVSLDDDMMRVFGADRMQKFMETFRVPEDMPIESKQVSDALDKVQAQAEDHFAGIRRQVSDFDAVLQEQRSDLYEMRRALLESDEGDLKAKFSAWHAQTGEDVVAGNAGDKAKAAAKLAQFFPALEGGEEVQEAALEGDGVAAGRAAGEEALRRKWDALERKRPTLAASAARYLALTQIDAQWSEQLTRMALLKEAVIMRKYQGNTDPLEEYRRDGTELFNELVDTVRLNTVYSLQVYAPDQQQK